MAAMSIEKASSSKKLDRGKSSEISEVEKGSFKHAFIKHIEGLNKHQEEINTIRDMNDKEFFGKYLEQVSEDFQPDIIAIRKAARIKQAREVFGDVFSEAENDPMIVKYICSIASSIKKFEKSLDESLKKMDALQNQPGRADELEAIQKELRTLREQFRAVQLYMVDHHKENHWLISGPWHDRRGNTIMTYVGTTVFGAAALALTAIEMPNLWGSSWTGDGGRHTPASTTPAIPSTTSVRFARPTFRSYF